MHCLHLRNWFELTKLQKKFQSEFNKFLNSIVPEKCLPVLRHLCILLQMKKNFGPVLYKWLDLKVEVAAALKRNQFAHFNLVEDEKLPFLAPQICSNSDGYISSEPIVFNQTTKY